MLCRSIGLLALLPVASIAQESSLVASSPCGDRSAIPDPAVCKDPIIKRLDSEVTAAYEQAKGRLQGDRALTSDLQDKQRFFVEDSDNAHATGGGRLQRYLETWQHWLDAIGPPREGFAGAWISGTGSFQIIPRDKTTFTVLVRADEPIQGIFTCEFIGVGRMDGEVLDVAWDKAETGDDDDAEGWTLRIHRSGYLLRLDERRNGSVASSPPFCGVQGSLADSYLPAQYKPEPVLTWSTTITKDRSR